ncbi:MAG: hypothetical protein KDC92_08445, partial [Bacteroidetes bacterium]|nr:hypothetical protein [Bacteroidota bacterium]
MRLTSILGMLGCGTYAFANIAISFNPCSFGLYHSFTTMFQTILSMEQHKFSYSFTTIKNFLLTLKV